MKQNLNQEGQNLVYFQLSGPAGPQHKPFGSGGP